MRYRSPRFTTLRVVASAALALSAWTAVTPAHAEVTSPTVVSDLADYAGRVRAVTPEQVEAAFAGIAARLLISSTRRGSLATAGPREAR